jgi:hypothetical protein
MDITPVSTVTIERACLRLEELARQTNPDAPGDAVAPCGQCEPCHRAAKLHLASYALKEEDPRGALLDLLGTLGLSSGV